MALYIISTSVATMNKISISLIFLIMISMVLPTSAIMYANGARTTPNDNSDASDSGSTEDNSDASDSGSTEDNSDASDSGSTDNNADLSTTFTENNPSIPAESTSSNNTGNAADFIN